jgi:hypothetical protein
VQLSELNPDPDQESLQLHQVPLLLLHQVQLSLRLVQSQLHQVQLLVHLQDPLELLPPEAHPSLNQTHPVKPETSPLFRQVLWQPLQEPLPVPPLPDPMELLIQGASPSLRVEL